MTRIMANLHRIGRAVRSAIVGDAVRRNRTLRQDYEIIRRLDLLKQTQTELLNVVSVQLEPKRPSRSAEVQASFLLVISVALIYLCVIWTVNASSISNRATRLHEEANATRTQALLHILPFDEAYRAITPAQLRQDSAARRRLQFLLRGARTGLGMEDLAIKMEVEADRYEAETRGREITAQMGLAVSSAFFGGILGWVITQLLTDLRLPKGFRRPRP